MNKILPTILLASIASVAISQQVLAKSPVATEEEISSPSSVELIMQQPKQQTGEVINLPAKEIQTGETIQIKVLDSPRRGMSMEQVRNEFGAPLTVTEDVGKPPITSWTYFDRVIFFEYSTVIHVVSK